MRYVLEPDNKNCPDDTLLGDLHAVATRLGETTITKKAYNAHGRFSAATLQNRFGSWNAALRKSGLLVQKRVDIPAAELLADLKRVATALTVRVLTTGEYGRVGSFSVATIQRTFGSWQKALETAGLEISNSWHARAADEELFGNLALVWESLGHQPRKSDLVPSLSRFSANVYAKRFGSWRGALESFVASATQEQPKEQRIAISPTRSRTQVAVKHRTQREPSWRLRFLVNRRDHFKCCSCGRSPSTHVGIVLHVDHKTAWSLGGETVLDNLQTLCNVCNIGKSNLSMHAPEG